MNLISYQFSTKEPNSNHCEVVSGIDEPVNMPDNVRILTPSRTPVSVICFSKTKRYWWLSCQCFIKKIIWCKVASLRYSWDLGSKQLNISGCILIFLVNVRVRDFYLDMKWGSSDLSLTWSLFSAELWGYCVILDEKDFSQCTGL